MSTSAKDALKDAFIGTWSTLFASNLSSIFPKDKTLANLWFLCVILIIVMILFFIKRDANKKNKTINSKFYMEKKKTKDISYNESKKKSHGPNISNRPH